MKPAPQPAKYTFEDWHAIGRQRFGIASAWWYLCPRCGLAFRPDHLGEPYPHDLLGDYGSTCPPMIGGCGFPSYGTRSIAEYRIKFQAMDIDKAGMVSVSKDRGTPFWVFDFCPEHLIPADGLPAKVMEVPADRYPDVRRAVARPTIQSGDDPGERPPHQDRNPGPPGP